VKHEPGESPHAAGAAYMDSPDPRTPHPGAAAAPAHNARNLLDQHKQLRKEVEKPMKVTIKSPPTKVVHEAADRQHQRWNDQKMQLARHSAASHIGIG